MSNSFGRKRGGLPPQMAYPDRRQLDTNSQHYQQMPEEPALSWPPQGDEQHQAWPQASQPAEDDYAGGQHWNGAHLNYPARQPAPPHSSPDPYGQPYNGYGQAPQPADPYRYPGEPGGYPEEPYSQPGFGASNGHADNAYPYEDSPASTYAAQFEAYTQPAGTGAPNGAQPYYGSEYGGTHDDTRLRGGTYEDPWAAPAGDPQVGYAAGDAAHYHADAEPYRGPEQWADPSYRQPNGGFPGAPYPSNGLDETATGWPPPADAPYPYAGQPYGHPVEPALVPQSQHLPVNEGYEEYDDEEEDEAPRSGRSRLLTVVGVLIGAVVIGAGLAYGYKTYVGGSTKIAEGPPVVRGDGQANKARPNDPGGRKFDHTDSKLMQRMSENGRASGTPNSEGTRRVSTMMIGRDGRIVDSGEPSLPSSPPPQDPVVSVPGLTVVDGFAAQRAASRSAPSSLSGSGPIVVTPPKTDANKLSPVRPAAVKKEPTRPPVAALPTRAPSNVVAKASPPKSSPPASKTKTKSAPKTKVTSTGSTGSAGSSKGYVAVLASVPVSASSRLDALKTFADIQQNYGNVLRDKTPDVREADLGAKGRYHRLMVGPPASRESASTLCKELKSAGYPSCWITSY